MNPSMNGSDNGLEAEEKPKLLPRETGHDIGLASPVPLSAEAVKVITGLRNMKVREFRRANAAYAWYLCVCVAQL